MARDELAITLQFLSLGEDATRRIRPAILDCVRTQQRLFTARLWRRAEWYAAFRHHRTVQLGDIEDAAEWLLRASDVSEETEAANGQEASR